MSLQAPLRWAQRKDNVYVTVDLRDLKNESIEIKEKTLYIKGTSDGKQYETSLNLFADVVIENCKQSVNGAGAQILLSKKDQEAEYWPRLTEEKTKNQFVTVDWTKYIDEDDEAEEGSKGLEDYDPSGMQGMGGMGGMDPMMMQKMMAGMGGGGMGGQDDSDDEDEQGGAVNDLDENEDLPELSENSK